jgi:sporadic carbohydrate cluster protein (TIGR04323 family)
MKLSFKGYISSRKLNDGNAVPQRVQNLVIRSACNDQNFEFYLSSTEYGMNNCYLILNQILKDLEKNKYDGIAFYSIDQLPASIFKTLKIFKKIINCKKKIYFSLENILISNKKKMDEVMDLIKIKKSVQ